MDMRTISLSSAPGDRSGDSSQRPVVDVVVPVYNEASGLRDQIRQLRARLQAELPVSWIITIADNGSTDRTPELADALAADLPDVRVLHLPVKGRGRALRAAWSRSDADVVAYTDVDLSTGVTALFPLVASILSGHADVAVGSRLLAGSHTTRSAKRELISRTYNRVLRVVLGTRIRDAQCGFKAVRADVARAVLPEIVDDGWFFDTELLIRAERHGLRIVELPVVWVEDPESSVDIVRTALDDLRGVLRLLRTLGPRRRSAPVELPAAGRRDEHPAAA
jgi:glycosyltransferase involved in cell wall biosynthesis